MTTNLTIIILIAIAIIILGIIAYLHRKGVGFTKLVFGALVVGIGFGLVIQLLYGNDSTITTETINWLSIVGSGYVALLQTLITPLIAVSLIGAFTKLSDVANLRKIGVTVLATLLLTTAVAALLGVLAVFVFHLQGAHFVNGTSADAANLTAIKEHQTALKGVTFQQQIINFFPTNIFADLAGTRATSTIAVVIFSAITGIAYLGLRKTEPTIAAQVAKGINVLDRLVHGIIKLILALTPYGIFALITKAAATDSLKSIAQLGVFIVAAYVALIAVLLVHTLILIANHINPIRYYKKVWPALIFAFTSRTSAGTLPLNLKIQTESLGINTAIANFAGSFGLTIGQNGCAGVYPAMIATIIAPTVGINVFTPQYILSLIAVVTLASFGSAGVGGGATFSTLMVLGTLNLPVAIMAVIIAIDPIVDMARTAVNVNDSILAGLIAAKATKSLDDDVLNDDGNVIANTL
ncbi:MAG: cation:dicarboxylase symporter family transporter [Lactobacillus sp.]|jgi:L-cystine uptake protein TcyP (sodium:dicarboxylate symporter family)|nr:cation:dicarboxylase symporter family transporter [Lactobacillus sp.]MCI2033947.1 cation:dicarboxylase symporter family transporter [Lactobacillus sp.]